ncbi:MAG: dihydroxyacetone kinase transcriptional activator DhaS [Firmicutes bacterium HGW-Firmicutes-7]|nr:MAG: dihydroxyacetone kinase transcriptional activator DhaS [Firmicutes bacterium HGW-Firmicutes-7]
MSQTTKKAISASLKKLMQDTPFDKITIVDIVNDCQVNRQTFYYHFKDIYELLGWIYKNEALTNIAEYKTFNTWQKGFLKIFTYVLENRLFCMNTFRSLAREHLEKFLYDIVFNLIIDVINEVAEDASLDDKEKTFISNFYSYAFIGILTNWMREGMKTDPQIIISDLTKLVDGNLKRAIHKYT